ncbi:MAG: hypothetical protein ACKVZJ_05020 [Phycisphaerales bacterium]
MSTQVQEIDNPMYRRHEAHFHAALGELHDADQVKKWYVPVNRRSAEFANIPGFSSEVLLRFANDALCGLTERELLMGVSTAPVGSVLLVEGQAGSGKSTALRFSFPEALKRNAGDCFEYMTMNFEADEPTIQAKFLEGEPQVYKYIEDKVIDRIKQLAGTAYSAHTEEMWDFFMKCDDLLDFAETRRALADVRTALQKGIIDKKDHDRRVYDARESYFKNRESIWSVVRYISSTRNKQPVLVYDNIDPLGPEAICLVVRHARSVSERHPSIKVFLPVRPPTATIIKSHHHRIDSLRLPSFEIAPPPALDVVAKRVRDIAREASINPSGEGLDEVDRDIIDYVRKRLAAPYSLDFITAATNGNLRKILTISNRTFASAAIDYDKVKKAWAGRPTKNIGQDPSHANLPPGIERIKFPPGTIEYELVARVVCVGGNYSYCEPGTCERFICNIWTDHGTSTPVCHFIRPLLLSYVYQDAGRVMRTTVGTLCDELSPFLDAAGVADSAQALRQQIGAFVAFGLLDTPQRVGSGIHTPATEWEIKGTDAGQVMWSRVGFSSFYFGFFKDAVHPGISMVRNGIKSAYAARMQGATNAIKYLSVQERALVGMLGTSGDLRLRNRYQQLAGGGVGSVRSFTHRLLIRCLLELSCVVEEDIGRIDGVELASDDSMRVLASMLPKAESTRLSLPELRDQFAAMLNMYRAILQ